MCQQYFSYVAGGFFSSVWKAIKYTIYLLLTYMIVRTAYNVKYKKMPLLAAIPHKDQMNIENMKRFKPKGKHM